MILQFIMKMTLIQHYESRIIRQPQGIAPTVKSNFTDGFFPQLRITNYELRIDPDTHVRASLREGIFSRCLDFPHNYALCITNYELFHRLYSTNVFTSSATH
jgi:hypothetical protein